MGIQEKSYKTSRAPSSPKYFRSAELPTVKSSYIRPWVHGQKSYDIIKHFSLQMYWMHPKPPGLNWPAPQFVQTRLRPQKGYFITPATAKSTVLWSIPTVRKYSCSLKLHKFWTIFTINQTTSTNLLIYLWSVVLKMHIRKHCLCNFCISKIKKRQLESQDYLYAQRGNTNKNKLL